jgi:hypothetical protein
MGVKPFIISIILPAFKHFIALTNKFKPALNELRETLSPRRQEVSFGLGFIDCIFASGQSSEFSYHNAAREGKFITYSIPRVTAKFRTLQKSRLSSVYGP